MNFLGAIILAALLLLAVFTLANWAVLTAPTTLSFVAFNIEGPLGVILLCITLVLVVLFVLYALTLRTNMLMESHHLNQELQAQRKLAESAETSRFNELHTQIDARMDTAEQSMKLAIDEATNSLAALVGEMDDKIDRALARGGNGGHPGPDRQSCCRAVWQGQACANAAKRDNVSDTCKSVTAIARPSTTTPSSGSVSKRDGESV